MSVQLEGLSETELKELLETANDYKERSQIRSAMRKIKKEKGEVKDANKAANYTRRGHQIEPTAFKLDKPAYFGYAGTSGSNRRKDLVSNVPKPKHFIPSMMSPDVKRKDTDDYLSSEGSKSSLSTVHSSAERTASHDLVSTVEKETAVRSNSYSFEQQMKIRNSPDLGYPESPVQTSPAIERPSYSSEHTESSDCQTQQNGTSDPQIASPQSPTEHDQTLTESRVIESTTSLEPAFNSIDTTHSANFVQGPVRYRSKTNSETSSASLKADGELDQLTQQLAYCDNAEEQVQLRKKIRETRELAGKGRLQKHTSFIQIDVKKGNSVNRSNSGSISPTYTPQHNTLDEGDESSDTPANIYSSVYGQSNDISPKSSNSPLHIDLDGNEIISNEYSSDDLEGDYVPNQDTAQITDLVQLVGDKPLVGRTGRKPTIKEDGNIDFTNVLEKSENHLKAKQSPRAPIEQHSFKGVLRKPSPRTVLSSPQNSNKNQEALQMDFRDVLTNKVSTNQHKNKLPPQKAEKPLKSKKSSDAVFDESLPQQLVFEHEHLPRSPSPEQLPIPSQSQDNNSNYNNCQDNSANTPDEEILKEEDISIKAVEALAYRRDSLQTGQDSRKRLRDLHKQASLTKLRQSIADDIPAVPSDPPILEESKQDELPIQHASPKIGTIEASSPLNPPTNNFASQAAPKLSSYEQRRLERKKKRESSEGRTAEEELQLQTDEREYMQARNKKTSGDKSPARSAKESYLKSAGIKNDITNSRSPAASPNSHSSRILNWAKSQTRGYDIEIKDLTHSWKNGLAFCALIHSYLPEEFDFGSLSASNPEQNMDLAFQVGSKYGVPQLFDPIDIIEMKVPDQRSIMTYLSTVYKELHNK